MTTKRLVIAPDPILKKVTSPVDEVDDAVRKLMQDMRETMYRYKGIGLAAPQINVTQRVLVIDISTDKSAPYSMANPEILWTSDNVSTAKEGCLSFPEQWIDITRPQRVGVRYLDANNAMRELEADGLLARCIQHEIDHLNGRLFIDHLSKARQYLILDKVAKYKARG